MKKDCSLPSGKASKSVKNTAFLTSVFRFLTSFFRRLFSKSGSRWAVSQKRLLGETKGVFRFSGGLPPRANVRKEQYQLTFPSGPRDFSAGFSGEILPPANVRKEQYQMISWDRPWDFPLVNPDCSLSTGQRKEGAVPGDFRGPLPGTFPSWMCF